MANLINTRICLRYDSYNNWKDSELKDRVASQIVRKLEVNISQK